MREGGREGGRERETIQSARQHPPAARTARGGAAAAVDASIRWPLPVVLGESLCIRWPSRSARFEPFAGPALAVALHARHVTIWNTIHRPRAGHAAAQRPLSNGRATVRGALPS